MPYFRNIPYTSTSHFLKEAHVKEFLFPLFPNVNLKNPQDPTLFLLHPSGKIRFHVT